MAENNHNHWTNIQVSSDDHGAQVAFAVNITGFTAAEISRSANNPRHGHKGSLVVADQFTMTQRSDAVLEACLDALSKELCAYYATEVYRPFPYGEKRRIIIRGDSELVLIDVDQMLAVSRDGEDIWLSINNGWGSILHIACPDAEHITEQLRDIIRRSPDGSPLVTDTKKVAE